MHDVLVIGGGCAGLAAATRLAECGAQVRLLESRAVLGGRSRSWVDPVSGDVEDNGQHLLMGCYDEFLAFVGRTGGIDELQFQPRMDVVLIEPGGRELLFRPGILPRPLDLLWGLLRLRGFPIRDALRASGLVREMKRGAAALGQATAEQWLIRHGQSHEARRRFWDPLILATLNLPPRQAPAALLAEVLGRALLGGPRASGLGYPRRGLGPLIVDPALRYLESRGCEVSRSSLVTGLEWQSSGRFAAARTRDGATHRAASVVLAVPHPQAAALLEGRLEAFGEAQAHVLDASPIVAIHLWFDREVCEHPIAGLLDSPVHWVFNRKRIGGAGGAGYLALVTSAADAIVAHSKQRLVQQALDEVRRFFPRAGTARLLRQRVLKERRATPRLRPATSGMRPSSRTDVANLVLAGDWTDTGLPATLEGAAASGHRAANLIATVSVG